MPSPQLAFTLLSEQLFTVYGLVFDLNFVQSADLSALSNLRMRFIVIICPSTNNSEDKIIGSGF